MRSFKHQSAESFQQAGALLKASEKENSTVIAGGTDLIGVLKTAILPDETAPGMIIDLKTIPNSAYISEDAGGYRVGALTRLVQIAEDKALRENLTALAEAAYSVATPVIRNVATIGGNICQDVRCWYYRYPHEVGNRFMCARKGGATCYAINGENRYHSVFGGMKSGANACSRNCPAGTDISAYMEKLRDHDWDGAARIILQANPMPMMTSRICPHPCQDNCNQNCYGESVGVHCVERTLGDYILDNAATYYCAPAAETGKKIAVIGAGPGGLACAYVLRSQGHAVTVMDSHEKAGGVLYYGIPHYRLPKAIVERYADALAGMGIEFRMNTTVGEDIAVEQIMQDYDLVYFGTGAWKQPILGIQGEELTEFGLNFLVEVNTFLKKAIDDDVLVCGGGNVAMDVALTAKRMGAKNVRLVCLEQEKEMPASAEEVARAREEGVQLFNGWGLKGVVTDDNGKVAGLKSMRCLRVFDEANRFSPVYDVEDTRIFEAKTIILATGQRVDIDFLGEKLGAQLKSARGLLEIDEETYQTKDEKIYAGGDAVTGPNIAIRAIRAGVAAAKAMSRKLGAPVVVEAAEHGFLKLNPKGIQKAVAAKLVERPADQRTLLDEDAQSLTQSEAELEAARCMNCGCYSVNASDISPVLLAMDAQIVTNKKTISAADFFTTKLQATDMLDCDEVVTEIQLPRLEGYASTYNKLRVRDSVDFAIVSMAAAYKHTGKTIDDIKLAFGGVAPVPVRATGVEVFLRGKTLTEEVMEQAAALAIKDTFSLDKNSYKLQEMKAALLKVLRGIV